MKRCLWIALAAILLLPLSADAQTMEDIVAKNVQARGGLEKLRAIKTARMTAKISEGDLRAAFVQENKRDNMVRKEFILQGMVRVQAYDGHTAWRINPFGGRRDADLISQEESKPLIVDADLEGPLVDYRQKGHKAELVGHDSVEGTDCYKIKLTLKDGDVRYYYLDADSFLEIKIETQMTVRGAVQYRDIMLGDYDQVDGVYFPFFIQTGEHGSEERTLLTIDKIELNVPLEDSRFSMPAAKPEAKPPSAAK